MEAEKNGALKIHTMERTRTGTLNIFKDFLKETGKNILMGSAAFRKWRATRPRSALQFSGSAAELDNYAFLSINLLKNHVGDIKGKHVCEIGAGDYLLSGLSILAAGARRYTVIDNFPGDYTCENAKRWYKGIEDNWAENFPDIPWAEGIKSEDFPENYYDRIELIEDDIETAATDEKFDVICSFQVGEHITDIDAFARANMNLLEKNGGVALHRVDFGPHDCWYSYDDPMTFLRFSDSAWSLTGSNRGVPNRFRHHQFMEAFERAGFDAEVVYSAEFEIEKVDFSRLNPKFKSMPRESLNTMTAIYLLRQKQ